MNDQIEEHVLLSLINNARNNEPGQIGTTDSV